MNEPTLHEVTCPWCLETVDIQLEPFSEAGRWVEDCDVCCHPMELELLEHNDGEWTLEAERSH